VSVENATGRPIGRPREFDPTSALDAALDAFWRYGYEGATLTVLTDAMRINKTSMYAAFGNKRALFDRALAHYAERDMSYVRQALEEPTARLVIEQFLRANVLAITAPGRPPGCFTVQGALACGPDNLEVTKTLAAARKAGEVTLRARLARAQRAGDLARAVDPAALARFVMTFSEGLAIHAAAGATRAELNKAVDIALHAIDA
jgi:AcrR family transcriptional regulator